MSVQSISAVTLAVRDMSRSLDFYRDGVGLSMLYGGPEADFTSLQVGTGYLNLVRSAQGGGTWWGRVVFYVDDVDGMYRRLVDAGVQPAASPQDAPWRERYFHVIDPDGHELSFARPLAAGEGP